MTRAPREDATLELLNVAAWRLTLRAARPHCRTSEAAGARWLGLVYLEHESMKVKQIESSIGSIRRRRGEPVRATQDVLNF